MKIYKIDHKEFNYDAYMGHVIIANTEDEVRKLAQDKFADEGKDVWVVANIECHGQYTGKETTPFILLSDFNAG